MEEEWKVFKDTRIRRDGKPFSIGYKLEISNQGNVRRNSIIVEPSIHAGYLRYSGVCIHRAVAELFVPNPDNKPCVDHINGNPLDNRAINLRWCTISENNKNPISLERRRKTWKSEEYRKQCSIKLKGRKGISRYGSDNPFYGHNHTEEQKKKQSEIMKNKHRVYDNPEHTKWHMENN